MNPSLRLLTYNIQTGISTSRYRDYVTHSWKHVLPHRQRMQNLDDIARCLVDYDFVGLQEVDAGSLRTGFINQTEYLAMRAGFPFWRHQTNRNFGRLAQHSIGLLSRRRIASVHHHRLPGFIPGRGALVAHIGEGDDRLAIVIVHLALGRRTRMKQLSSLASLLQAESHVVVMGDFNFHSGSAEMDWLLGNMDLREPIHGLFSFPSWEPDRSLDHILVSSSLNISRARVLDHAYSDHLPVAMEIELPQTLAAVVA